ncbi:MAG: DUF4856 domain-containing protein [Salinisphaeraceae bacterium]|nr:DUF4856 domain-containing protein [Salinisphaeraceae bacterium]
MTRSLLLALFMALSLGLTGCLSDDGDDDVVELAPDDGSDGGSDDGGSDDGDGSDGDTAPSTYEFESSFEAGESSVSYQGQICRQVLIIALKNAVEDATEIAKADYRSAGGNDGSAVPYFDDTIAGTALADASTQNILGLDLPVPEAHDTLGELCGTKFLKGKFAGNDTVTDWKDWNTEFQGVAGFSNAESYLRELLKQASELAESGASPADAPHYVSGDGLDYSQLIQKFVTMAVAFAQGTDDYLSDDVDGKGLNAAFEKDGDSAYAKMEHQWDEGYGYFGAARAYNDRSDEVNRSGVVDDNNDGFIDLNSEHNFAASTNAAKRDVGSTVQTDLSGDAFDNLIAGRHFISTTQKSFADMSAAEQAELLGYRDAAVQAWEKAYAATVVHYINDTLADMDDIGTPDFDIANIAKHFSEMKGFALGLQFNPDSPLNDLFDGSKTRFERLHELLRDKPPCTAGVCTNEAAYRNDLLTARDLLGTAYGFAQSNLENW